MSDCEYRINGECWCEKALVSFHNVPKLSKLSTGKVKTVTWMDDLASTENKIDYGWDNSSFNVVISTTDILNNIL